MINPVIYAYEQPGVSMGVTVEQALKFGGLAQGVLLAGKRNLDNSIEYVNIMESPYQSSWPARNQLYITAFYALIDDIEGQKLSLKMLNENGCAALCFQSLHFPELSPDVINYAEELGLPLIQVSPSVPYSQIISPLVEAIYSESNQISSSTLSATRKLMDAYVPGGGIQQIVTALNQCITFPIDIINKYGNKLSESNAEDSTPIVPEFETIILDDLGSSPTTSWIESRDRWFVPIYPNNKTDIEAYLTILDPDCQLVTADIILAEQAANLVASELAIKRSVWETENRLRKDFIDDLLSSNIPSTDKILERARSLKLDLVDKRVAVICKIHQLEQLYPLQKNQILQAVVDTIHQNRPGESCYNFENCIVIFPGFEDSTTFPMVHNSVNALAEQIKKCLTESFAIDDFSIAIGDLYKGVEAIRQSYDEAHLALSLLEEYGDFMNIVWYNDVAIYPILKKFICEPGVNQWFEKTLGPLIKYDQVNRTALIKTLETYFDTNQKLMETAHKLSIHPKTLRYRLKRIEEITGEKVFLGEKQFLYYLVTKLMKFYSSE